MLKKSLVQIAFEYQSVLDLIMESEGEVTPEIENFLNLSGKELTEKIDAYGFILDRLELEEVNLKNKLDVLRKKKTTTENLIDKIKSNLISVMGQMQTNRIEGDKFTFTTKPTRGIISVSDVLVLSPEFIITKTDLVADKEKIREALSAGRPVAGAVLQPGVSITRKEK